MEIRSDIPRVMSPRTSALTIIGGDFNYVTDSEDRYAKASMQWTGAKDLREAEDWKNKIESPFAMHEIYQPVGTHSSGIARSRLDWVYVNNHVCDQQDAKYGCACVEWVPNLSHHRPVVFYRFKARKTSRPNIVDEGIFKDPAWATNVSLRYLDLCQQTPNKKTLFVNCSS